MYCTLTELKRHLNIEADFIGDDEYLQDLIEVTAAAIGNYCLGGLSAFTGTTYPIEVKHAQLLLAAHYYLNRQPVAFAQGQEIPYTFQFLLNPYKTAVVC